MRDARRNTITTLLGVACLLAAGWWLAACSRTDSVAATPVERVRLDVTVPGIYQVTGADLQRAGLAVDALDPAGLRLASGGVTVPYLVRDDALLFYGEASDSPYSAVKPYVLTVGEAGALIDEADTQPVPGTVDRVWQRLHLEDNKFYDPRAFQSGVTELWFWETIRNVGNDAVADIAFELPEIDDSASAEMRLNLYGASYDNTIDGDHDADLLINGQQIDTITWDGQTHYTATVTLPAGALRSGDNTVTIDNSKQGAALIDIILLNWIELVYAAQPRAADDTIAFENVSGTVTLTGFSDSPLVLDVTNPAEPRRLPSAENDTTILSVTEEMRVAAAGPDGYLTPDAITPLYPTTLRDADNQADMLIVTTEALLPELTPLIEARNAGGLSTYSATVDEIYAEFGDGAPSPLAIRDFVAHAATQWADPAPRYLFLVGDATTDGRGYMVDRDENPVPQPSNVVPSLLIEVSHSGETVSDARLADVDGDLKPDLAVGRWPVADPADVRALVERTLAYEAGASADTALFAMDGTSTEFSNFTDRLLQQSGFPVAEATLLNGASAETVAQNWNDGAWLISYVGHGSLDLWGKDELFSVDRVSAIDDDAPPPIVLQFTCLSGQFAHPEVDSLSEALLKHDSGPVVLVGASSLTLSSHQEPFAVALLDALQDPALTRVGDAFQQAKQAIEINGNVGLQEISDTFGLFGDPSVRIIRPNGSGVATSSD